MPTFNHIHKFLIIFCSMVIVFFFLVIVNMSRENEGLKNQLREITLVKENIYKLQNAQTGCEGNVTINLAMYDYKTNFLDTREVSYTNVSLVSSYVDKIKVYFDSGDNIDFDTYYFDKYITLGREE